MRNEDKYAKTYINISNVKQTPYIRKDGFQEAVLSFRNSKKFNAWYKVYIGDAESYVKPMGTVSKGKGKVTVLLTDTNAMVKPGETVKLKIEFYDNEKCCGNPVGVYENANFPRTRHWEFYYSQTMHTDLGYTDYQEDLRPLFSAFLDTVKQYMKNSDQRETDVQKYKYAIESGWVMGEGYMSCRNAEEIEEILDLIKKDRMTIGAGCCNHTMECFSTEETARAAYYTNRYLVDKLGISPSTTQRMFDNPAFSKSYVDIAASVGIKYGIHSMNPDRSPYYKKKQYDLFYMQGNNPKNKLLIFNGKTYGDNYGFGGTHNIPNYGSAKIAQKRLMKIISELESRTGRRSYPYDKFPLPLIPYGDNKQPMEMPIKIANEINRRYEDKGYVYPKITVDFPEKFFEDVEKEYGHLIPVETGTEENWWNDGWGTTAFESGINKEAGFLVPMAETAASLSSLLFGSAYPHEDIDCAVKRNLIYDEHTWGYHSYTGDEMYNKQFEWKRSNAFAAKSLAEKVLSDSVKVLASKVKVKSQSIYVYNSLNWIRDDVAIVDDISTLPEFFEIKDGEKSIPYALDNEKLTFVANDVPPMGYKVFTVREKEEEQCVEPQRIEGNIIENEFYKVSFDNDGTIKSIVDKENGGREIADCSCVKFNQYQYYDDFGIPFSNMGIKFSKYKWKMYSPKAENTVLSVSKTPASVQAIADTGTFRAGSIRQKVTLYNGIPRIDIVNEVVKSPLPSLKSKEEAFYVFSFKSGEDYEIRYDLPVGNAAEGEQVYGTSTDWYTASKWVNVYDKNDDYSMTLAIPNSALLQFGERRTGNWSFDYKSKRPYIYSYIFNNMWQTNFQGDQPGYAAFRYSVYTQKGKNLKETNQSAWNCCSPLKAVLINNVQDGVDKLQDSYVRIDKDNVILTTMKMAEANGDGMIVRFCEIGGENTEKVRVTLPDFVSSYVETDVVENNISKENEGNIISFDIPAYGFKTFRIVTSDTLAKVTGVKAIFCEKTDTENLSLKAQVTASSVYGGMIPQNALTMENPLEWATDGKKEGKLELKWEEAITVGAVRIADRVNSDDNIESAVITFSDGSSYILTDIPHDGKPKTLLLDTPKHNVSSVTAEIKGTKSTKNCGLLGFEIYEKAPKHTAELSGTHIVWNKVKGAAYYEVFRIRDNGSPMFIAATKENELFDSQVTFQIADKYKYVIRACASGLKGEFSDSVYPEKGEGVNILPPQKLVLHADAREKQRIDLFWTPVPNNTLMSHYEIYRNGEKIADTPDSYVCTYRDRSVDFGNTYTYSVVAIDKYFNKCESEPLSIDHKSDILINSDSNISRRKNNIFYSFFRFRN